MAEFHLNGPLPPLKMANWWLRRPNNYVRYLSGAAAIVICLGVSLIFERVGLSIPNIVMLFVLAVAIVAAIFGTGPSILASVLASATLAFFFLPPLFSLAVSDAQQVFMLMIMSMLALLISHLTDQVRSQAAAAESHAERNEALYSLSSAINECSGTASVATIGARQLRKSFGVEVFILLPQNGELKLAGDSTFKASTMTADESHIATEAFRYSEVRAVDRHGKTATGHVQPMFSGARTVGVTLLRLDQPLDSVHQQLFVAMVQQIADALERDRLSQQVRAKQIEAETERLRSGMLSSITHDLRTPLAIITGAGSSLLDSDLSLPHDAMVGMCHNIVEYSQRMARLVDNLLNMTRIESGFLHVNREMHVLEEVIGAALTHMRSLWGDRKVRTEIPPGLRLIPLDDVLFQQVLVNLLENVHKYTPRDASVEFTVSQTATTVIIELSDRGPGLQPGEEARIFEKFFRGHAAGERQQGTGLGLAICRAIVTAHRGEISARNRTGGGLTIRIELPLAVHPPAELTETTTASNVG